MPDELGAKTEWFPIRLDVSWNVPDGGEPQHFDIKIRAINTKANAAAEPPEVIGYLDFDISKH
jgi:hypothetical protein